MSVAIVTDSACDLPDSFIAKHNIHILPARIRINGELLEDLFSEQQRLNIYNSGFVNYRKELATQPAELEYVYDFFFRRVIEKKKKTIAISVAKSRSLTHNNWSMAAEMIARQCHGKMDTSKCPDCQLEIVNSGSVFSAQGILTAHVAEQVSNGLEIQQIIKELDFVVPKLKSFVIPRDISYLRERALLKRDNSVSLFRMLLGKSLNLVPVILSSRDDIRPLIRIVGWESAVDRVFLMVARRIKEGLALPVIIISYAGDLTEIENRPQMKALRSLAASKCVTIMTNVMSICGGINSGPGTLCIGLASENDCNDI